MDFPEESSLAWIAQRLLEREIWKIIGVWPVLWGENPTGPFRLRLYMLGLLMGLNSIPRFVFLVTLGCSLINLSPWVAALTVNAPLPIQKQLDVQIIQTGMSNGSEYATIFGTPQQQVDIERNIDLIWAQAGINVNFLPTINRYANDFAFVGTESPRPQSDLTTILNSARAAGVLHENPIVLNMLFVDVTPGFAAQGSLSVSGIGRISGNGTAIYVGTSLLSTASNRELIAGVVAHEIGHNLGLPHTDMEIANLMSPNGTTDQLTADQIATVLDVGAPWLSDYTLTADFTGDGWVNTYDLGVWTTSYSKNSNADSDHDGDSDGRDFLAWQKEFSVVGMHFGQVSEIPEPASGVLLVSLLLLEIGRRWRNR